MRSLKYSGISWYGDIPSTWTIAKIKDIFSVISGSTPDSNNLSYWEGDIIWITPADYKTGDKYVSKGRKSISQNGYDSCGTTMIPKGSVIFSKRAPIGSVAINTAPLCTNQGCLSCIPNNATSSLYYYYVMSVLTEAFELYGSGTTFKEISAKDFSNFHIPFPPYNEQQCIADFLDRKCADIDNVLEKTKASIEEYKKLKQSVITEAATKGIRGERPMKDSGIEWIGTIPKEWIVCKLKNLSSVVTDGAHISPEEENGVFDFISTVNLDNGKIDFDHCLKTSENSYNYMVATGCKPQIGDVLISKDGTVGKTALVAIDRDFVVSSSLVIIRPRQEAILSSYLNYSLQSKTLQEKLVLLMAGTGLKRVSVAKNANLQILVPNISEQHEIVAYLDKKCSEIDSLIASKEKFITELESYKKSLIYEYVTGKKEILYENY